MIEPNGYGNSVVTTPDGRNRKKKKEDLLGIASPGQIAHFRCVGIFYFIWHKQRAEGANIV